MTVAEAVAGLSYREELISLFAGEVEEGYPVTSPCYRLHLAIEICRNVDPGTVASLVNAVYGTATPIDTIPANALEILAASYHQWKHETRMV